MKTLLIIIALGLMATGVHAADYTITITDAQDEALTKVTAEVNAANETALTSREQAEAMIRSALNGLVDRYADEDAVAACQLYRALSKVDKSKVNAFLGTKSPCTGG